MLRSKIRRTPYTNDAIFNLSAAFNGSSATHNSGDWFGMVRWRAVRSRGNLFGPSNNWCALLSHPSNRAIGMENDQLLQVLTKVSAGPGPLRVCAIARVPRNALVRHLVSSCDHEHGAHIPKAGSPGHRKGCATLYRPCGPERAASPK